MCDQYQISTRLSYAGSFMVVGDIVELIWPPFLVFCERGWVSESPWSRYIFKILVQLKCKVETTRDGLMNFGNFLFLSHLVRYGMLKKAIGVLCRGLIILSR